MVQGKITEADALSQSGHHWTIGTPASIIPPFFTLNALSDAMLPIYPGFRQALNNAGLHTQRLDSYESQLLLIICWFTVFVEGDDEQSSKLVESFSDVAVRQLIGNSNCVALLIPAKRSAKCFVFDICNLVPLRSLRCCFLIFYISF